MTAAAAVSILILILIIVAIAWAAFWIIDQMGLPGPMPMVAKVIVGLIALLFLLTRTGLA